MTSSTNPPADGQIADLIALIKNATTIIESHFLKSSLPIVPSLDSLAPHPLDTAPSPPQLRNAVQVLEGASAQLCATLARPSHTVLNRALQIYEPACLRVVIYFKIADILQEQPSGMQIEELGERAGVNHEKLGRIMRLLATKHIFREVAADRFANNRLSLELLSSNPLTSMISHLSVYNFSTPTNTNFDQWPIISTDENNKGLAMLTEVLSDPEWGHSEAFERSPWNKSTGFDDSLYRYFEGEAPEGAKQGTRFGIAMHGWNDASQAAATVVVDFPWGTFPPGTIVNDVGGGIGSISMELIKKYPNLQIKLQDLPRCICQAETEVWPKLLPSAIAEKRIEFKAMDFLVDSPIEGCDLYYLKGVIHDWPDKECIKILRNIRAVLKPGARVLLHEYILQHASGTDPSSSAFTEAPEPMLPNYGAGKIRSYNLDLCLLVLFNSRERTLEDLIKIASKADLRFVKLWHVGEMGVVELQSA